MDEKKSDDLKVLTRCISDIEADLIVQLLEENGIESFVDTNIPHSVWPVSADALVMVREIDYEKAKKVLSENIEGQNAISEDEDINMNDKHEGD